MFKFLVFSLAFLPTSSATRYCQSKGDGFYSIAEDSCSQKFYECRGNRTFTRSCPGDLFYRQEAERCDAKELNPFCDSQGITGKDGKFVIKLDEFCLMRGNGKYSIRVVKKELRTSRNNYADPIVCRPSDEFKYQLKFPGRCTEIYWQCVHGRALQLSCPYGLKFNVVSDSCDHKQLVKDCNLEPQNDTISLGNGGKVTVKCLNGRFAGKL
ncbi:unnamed protein product [Bursaphelenchus xylophilus]|uniref:(pine wood nematode) hypothetical protein n=1 Tax=Bursaphelenchus xylophilus TaxID=6326 RepID=A0A1I7SWZ9_BURXY|nr:unnamed protein product [Bursaphelenchus xylophilus]CAG9100078.1 unnamed protein product [Bursaphelenchus xylophilus]